MKKSQIESKLDQDLYCTVKAHATEADIIHKNSDNNKKKDDKCRNEKDFGLSDVQSYANAVELTCIR